MLRHVLRGQELEDAKVQRSLEVMYTRGDLKLTKVKKAKRVLFDKSKKEMYLKAYKSMGWSYARLKLHFGPKCPPRSTILGYTLVLALAIVSPSFLTQVERGANQWP